VANDNTLEAEGPLPIEQQPPTPLRGRPPTGRGRTSISAYLNEVQRHRPMSRETEHDIAVEYCATRDPRLSAQLVTANLRLVVKIARQYRGVHSNLADLVQEGNIGLVQAVHRYDPNRGVKLSTYAAWWIRAYILQFVMSNYRLVRMGTTQAQRKLFFNLRKERAKLERQGIEVQPRQLAAALDVTEAEVIEMERRLDASETSIDAPKRGKYKNRPRDVVATAAWRPDLVVEKGEFNAILVDKLHDFGATLGHRDGEIFRSRLFNEEPAQLVQIAEQFGVSRERIRQLEDRLKQRLREYLEEELGDAVEIDMVH
jgi:RNA polymerase sigma-32 factor